MFGFTQKIIRQRMCMFSMKARKQRLVLIR